MHVDTQHNQRSAHAAILQKLALPLSAGPTFTPSPSAHLLVLGADLGSVPQQRLHHSGVAVPDDEDSAQAVL